MNTIKPVLETNVSAYPVKRGKVRDVYDLGNRLILAASDRISAFDVVMPNGIPLKGVLLTQISNFWFDKFADQIENHLVSTSIDDMPDEFKQQPEVFTGRSVLTKKLKIIPIECVVRGYITGSGWKDYQKTGEICGIKLPEGLQQCQQVPEPIYTPATKAVSGHDENVSFEEAAKSVGADILEQAKQLSIKLYTAAAEYAQQCGIIIADTKFEFGQDENGKLILADEILTPDSSRFWPADQYEPGHDQPSFDKQFVRNYLETLDWDKTPPGPQLPPDVVESTTKLYIEAYQRLTGKTFQPQDYIKG